MDERNAHAHKGGGEAYHAPDPVSEHEEHEDELEDFDSSHVLTQVVVQPSEELCQPITSSHTHNFQLFI